jgi:hypothetical protein
LKGVVPVLAEINIDDYRQKTPRARPGAQLTWSKPFSRDDESAAVYSMQ